MKSNNEFRPKGHVQDREETMKKAGKLPPIKKSGKERHALYSSLDDDDDATVGYRRRESVLDYFDDMEENEGIDEDQLEDDLEDDWEEESGEDGEDEDWG